MHNCLHFTYIFRLRFFDDATSVQTQNFSNLVNVQQGMDVKIKLERLQFSAIANLTYGMARIHYNGTIISKVTIYPGVYSIFDIRDKILNPLLKDTNLKNGSIKKNELKGRLYICRLSNCKLF